MNTTLHAAAAANDTETLQALLTSGADLETRDAEGRLEILLLTLAAGANLKDTNRYGGTALIPACHHGRSGCRAPQGGGPRRSA